MNSREKEERKMAKEKRKQRVKVDPNLVDYYRYFGLTRSKDRKTLLNMLRQKQGELEQKKAAGALNEGPMMDNLLTASKQVADAIHIFKDRERFEKYNAQLDAAIANGTLNQELQSELEAALNEIEKLFLKGNYAAVIKRCRMDIDANGGDRKLYSLLTQSYMMLDQNNMALSAAEEYIKAFPDELDALDLGLRCHILVNNDIEKAQIYLNKILEKNPESIFAAIDQIYIHLAEKNIDMAFKEIDDYISAHPTDRDFKTVVAHDIIGCCSKLYICDKETDTLYLASDKDYKLCKTMSDKAASLCRDPEIKEFEEMTNHMGEKVLNEYNLPNIVWSFIAAALYGISGLVLAMQGEMAVLIMMMPIALLCTFIAVMLVKVSRRPYWQIYKYELTGKRERKEKIFIILGTILSGYMRWSVKITFWLIKLIFGFLFRRR